MTVHALRFKPGQDLKRELDAIAKSQNLQAGFIITCATIGGHLLEGNEVFTTAEIVIGEAEQLQFHRETDPVTSYKELTVKKRE